MVFLRFQDFPDAEMQHVVDYLDRGGPVVGLRTATHAFQIQRPDAQVPEVHLERRRAGIPGGFGRQMLGETWVSHYGTNHKQSSRLVLQPDAGAASDPARRARTCGCSRAATRRIPIEGSHVLALGQILDGMTPDCAAGRRQASRCRSPGTRTYHGASGTAGRVFTTTHGASEDLLNDGFRRHARQRRAVGARASRPRFAPTSDIGFVGPFRPSTLQLRRLRERHEAGRPGGLGVGDSEAVAPGEDGRMTRTDHGAMDRSRGASRAR